MPFKKGQSGNPKGKPKGAKNKTDEQLRDFLRKVTTEYFSEESTVNFYDDLTAMKPSMRFMAFEKYLKYFLPSMSAVKMEGEINNTGELNIVVKYSKPDASANTEE